MMSADSSEHHSRQRMITQIDARELSLPALADAPDTIRRGRPPAGDTGLKPPQGRGDLLGGLPPLAPTTFIRF
jgi:hypothetical protein